MKENMERFLKYELGLLTLKAALSTRDKEYTVYDPIRDTFIGFQKHLYDV